MKLEIFKPSPQMKEYIQYYWLLECTPSPEEMLYRVIPTGLPELLVNYGDRFICSGDEPGTLQPRMNFCGQKKTFYDIEQTGHTRLLSALFTPLGAAGFFQPSFSGILNRGVSLCDMFPGESDRLFDSICAAPSSMQKINILENFIIGKMNSGYRKDYLIVNGIMSFIRESRGMITVDTICDRFSINAKYLERRFSEYIGMPPKSFLRIVRFQNALDTYNRASGSLTDLSLDCGYYDQSHFIRDVKEFSGLTPQEFFTKCSVHSDFFAA